MTGHLYKMTREHELQRLLDKYLEHKRVAMNEIQDSLVHRVVDNHDSVCIIMNDRVYAYKEFSVEPYDQFLTWDEQAPKLDYANEMDLFDEEHKALYNEWSEDVTARLKQEERKRQLEQLERLQKLIDKNP